MVTPTNRIISSNTKKITVSVLQAMKETLAPTHSVLVVEAIDGYEAIMLSC